MEFFFFSYSWCSVVTSVTLKQKTKQKRRRKNLKNLKMFENQKSTKKIKKIKKELNIRKKFNVFQSKKKNHSFKIFKIFNNIFFCRNKKRYCICFAN